MFNLKIYKSGKGFLGKINTSLINSVNTKKEILFIVILDVSGSMGQLVPRFVNTILPKVLENLNIKNEIKLITFSEASHLYNGDANFFKTLQVYAEGSTYMSYSFKFLKEVLDSTSNKFLRILTISDGELDDQKATVSLASEFSEVFKNHFKINSQAVRLYTSSSEPDTIGLSSMLQFNSVNEPKLIDIQGFCDVNDIIDMICDLFKNDGLDYNLRLKANEKIFLENPWDEGADVFTLINGENIFWLNKIPEKIIVENENFNQICNIEICENLTVENYQKILENKIKYFYQKIKVLKIVNTKNAAEEMNKIVEYFENFENILNLQKIEEEKNLTNIDKFKISNRAFLLKKLIEKRNSSISHKMKEIKNDDKVSKLNSKQLADFLRNLDINKDNKKLSKRGLKEGINFDEEARKEVLDMSKHICEICDIDDSSHTVSFYSTSTTLEGIKTVCELAKDVETFESVTAIDIIKLLNIVGIGCDAPIGNYTDPATYRLNDIYIGCYISLSDILTASEYNGGKNNLIDFNTKKQIVNVIPFFDDSRIHEFLLKYAPKLLEYTASIGMRRLLIEVQYSYEFLIEAGIWKFSEIFNSNRRESAINVYCKLISDCEIVSKSHYEYLIKIILKQIKNYKKFLLDEVNKMQIFLNDNSIVNMTYVFIYLINNNEMEILPKICRELFCHGVHKIVNKLIKNSENHEDFIKKYLEDLLEINYEKNGNKLPELFQENKINEFYDNYSINYEKLNKFYEISFRALFIPFTPYYLRAALQEDKKAAFAKLPKFNEENVKQYLNIMYDFNYFKLFAVVQAFLFRTNDERLDLKNKSMKIIDLDNFENADKMVRNLVRNLYKKNFEERMKKQNKSQIEILENNLIDILVKTKDLEEFSNLIKFGLSKGNTTSKIENVSSSGFTKLKNRLINSLEEIPEVLKKIAVLVTGRYKEKKVFNNGNCLRDISCFKNTICNIDKNYWEKLLVYVKSKFRYVYRNLPNRHGHSNEKPSFWALGFSTIEEMFKIVTPERIEKYKQIHTNCCGLDHGNFKLNKKRKRN